jgi:hypothetical protein
MTVDNDPIVIDDDRRHLAEVADQLFEFSNLAPVVPANLPAIRLDAVDGDPQPFIRVTNFQVKPPDVDQEVARDTGDSCSQ